MKFRYVAIEREYGSGGTKIAEMTAQLCGIQCYGSQIPKMVSERMNVSISQIMQYEEKATNSLLYSVYLMSKSNVDDSSSLSGEALVYLEEQRIIRELAQQNDSGIFVGRCASNALGEDVLRVFIHADREFRHERACSDYGISNDEADSVIRRFDKRRASYYNANTGHDWRSSSEYDLILDSGRLGIELCAQIIKCTMEGGLQQK